MLSVIAFLLVLSAVFSLTGCASLLGEPTEAEKLDHARAIAKAETAQSEAAREEAILRRSEVIRDTARYSAIGELARAKKTNPAINTLAVGLAMEGVAVNARANDRQALAKQPPVVMAPPQPRRHDLYDWVMGFGTLGVQAFGIDKNAAVAMRQSDNARDMQLGAYGAINGVAAHIQSAGAVSNTYQIGGNGIVGNGTYSDTRTASGNGASTNGNGGYSQTDNHAVDSHNVLDSHDATDSHNATATPTVVTQPSPLVVPTQVVTPIIWTPAP